MTDQVSRMIPEETGSSTAPERDGRLYWFYRNSIKRLSAWFAARRRFAIGIGVVLALLAFIFRAMFQHYVIQARCHLFLALVVVPIWYLIARGWRGKRFGPRVALLVSGVVLTYVLSFAAVIGHRYVTLYLRYRSLNVVDLETIPITGHERIQPLNSIYSLAHEIMTEVETPMLPDFVRVGDEYRWTLAIEPAYPLSRIFGGVGELFNVSATAASPNFGSENRIKVSFEVGENLMFGRNAAIASIRSFGPWRFFNYEPADVTYVRDDNNQWVEIVSLVRWRGLLFPQPEFGGVQVVRQSEGGFVEALKLLTVGTGEWIPPEDVPKHPYLRGQNILPVVVSRNIANSFRFQAGFFGPLPGYHREDVRIPDMVEDVNDQPFPGYFEIADKGALYHYFGLEPFDPAKQGLNTSLFVPADGTPDVYVYRHAHRAGTLTGVSAIAAKVMESRKNYDWSRNRPVEHRPFIKNIAGKTRFFWLTTVVTLKEQESGDRRFIAGSVPDVVLTDATYNTAVWVDPLDQSGWLAQLERDLSGVWSAK